MSLQVQLQSEKRCLTLPEIYELIGWGPFQWRLFIAGGLGFMADSIETGLITFLTDECSKEWPGTPDYQKNLLSTGVFIGELLGCFVWGPVADKIGRTKAFLYCNLVLVIFGVASAAAPSYLWFIVFRFIVGTCVGGLVIPFDLLAESCDGERMLMLTFSIEYFWTLGTLYVNGLAAAVLPTLGWRWLTVLAAVPLALAVVGYFFIVESPVWLVVVGRKQDAMKALQKAAAMNGVDLDGVELVCEEPHDEAGCTELAQPQYRARTVVLFSVWLLGLFGYYGASFATPLIFGTSDGTNYGAVFFASSGEIVGVALCTFISLRIGVMKGMGLFYAVAAVACFALMSCHQVPVWVAGILAFVCRAGVMGGSCATWVATPPAYPATVRSTAHGMCNAMGRVGGIMATAWPGSTPDLVKLASYGGANAVCVLLALGPGRRLLDDGHFDKLATEVSVVGTSSLCPRGRSSLLDGSGRVSKPV